MSAGDGHARTARLSDCVHALLSRQSRSPTTRARHLWHVMKSRSRSTSTADVHNCTDVCVNGDTLNLSPYTMTAIARTSSSHHLDCHEFVPRVQVSIDGICDGRWSTGENGRRTTGHLMSDEETTMYSDRWMHPPKPTRRASHTLPVPSTQPVQIPTTPVTQKAVKKFLQRRAQTQLLFPSKTLKALEVCIRTLH
jgi:hypothetical protein